jgi:glycopeptide antibiotics resistance protein
MYLGYVLILTLYPFEFSGAGLQSFNVSSFFAGLVPRDFIINSFLFLPLGGLVHCRLATGRTKLSAILLSALVGAVISILIELLQIFFERHPSARDIAANTLGTAAGAVLWALWPRRLAARAGHAWERVAGSPMLLCAAVLYGALPLILSVVQFVEPFRTWNSLFSFQIGNEATFNRPWLGKIHFVALYNRALPAAEIGRRFRQSSVFGLSKNRAAPGLISLYMFNEGEGDVIHDLSGFEAPLDLHISPVDGVRWLNPNGIEILRPAILKSQGAGTKLFDAVSESHEFSIEMWIAPKTNVHGGFARIVSFSHDRYARNFTVGQRAANVEFRVRTPVTGRNGAPLALRTKNGFLNSETVHIVATYKAGIQKLYSNGAELPETLDLTRDGIIGFGARKTTIAHFAYSFFYFAPMSFLCASFFSRRAKTVIEGLLMPIALTMTLLSITECFQASVFDRSVDIRLFVCGLMISSIVAVAGVASNKRLFRQV